MRIILASASPRRKELLKQIGLEYEVRVSDAEELVTSTVPAQVVEELARQKAENVYRSCFGKSVTSMEVCKTLPQEKVLIVSADTIVACDGQILGKPKDSEDAKTMLRMLQGRVHEVYTGVSFLYYNVAAEEKSMHSFHEITKVHFYPMTEQEIADYVATGDPMDKAGAYGIQGLCARYVRGIEGDYNNVVGLPVGRLYQEMKAFLAEEIAL